MIKLVQEYFINSAKKFPDKVAVNFLEENIKFRELESYSNQLARALKKRGVGRGNRIAFGLSKSNKAVKTILGILKADATYVPLNAQAPPARNRQIIEDVEPKLVIVDEKTKNLSKEFSQVFNIDEEHNSITKFPDTELIYQNQSSDLAYILYTSGSTGKPKGVMITHGNIVNATDWAVEELGITSDDRMSQHPPFHFDLSTFDIYCAWKTGATLYLVPEELSLFPGPLMKFIEAKQLTIWNSVPSVMVYMSTAGLVRPGRLPTVKKIFFNGEGFPTKFLAEWMKTYPDKIFVNMYGPTEATVQCTFYRIPEPPADLTKLVPIGKACRNVEVFAVKEEGILAGVGEVGELYVGGLGVGQGYWSDSVKTSASFITYPFDHKKGRVYKTGDLVKLLPDGNYEFLGRQDNQVKIRGNRIELGDVDSALFSLPYINEAATIAVFDKETGGNKLVAFVDFKILKDEKDMRDDLVKILPPYMIPDEIWKRKLPKTSTGKIDRVKLKEDYLKP